MDKLRSMLSARKSLVRFYHPIRLPLDPVCRVVGILAEEASLFKSALMPARLGFRTTEEETYWVSGRGEKGREGRREERRGEGREKGMQKREGREVRKGGYWEGDHSKWMREGREKGTYSPVKSFLNPSPPPPGDVQAG